LWQLQYAAEVVEECPELTFALLAVLTAKLAVCPACFNNRVMVCHCSVRFLTYRPGPSSHGHFNLAERLQAACPRGIDIYFENVGGAVFDAVLPLLNNFARIPVCGLIAHYNATELPPGPDRVALLMRSILVKRLTFRGFIVMDYRSQIRDFFTDMSGWPRGGQVKYREDITDGLENAPRELVGLLRGENFGKKIIRVSPDPTKR
jgi:NADPH-dependent curcumin reductase CurA